MIDHFKIAKLLRQRLASISGLPSIANENTEFTPTVNAPYLRESVLFNDTFTMGVAEDSAQRQNGVYQIDVLTDKNSARMNGLAICELVRAGFAREARALIDGDTIINLEGSSVSPGYTEGEYFVYSVSVRWTIVA